MTDAVGTVVSAGQLQQLAAGVAPAVFPAGGGAGTTASNAACAQSFASLLAATPTSATVGSASSATPIAAAPSPDGDDTTPSPAAITAAPATLTGVALPTSPAATAPAAGAAAYMPLISQAAARYGIDPALLYGVIRQESAFDPNAVSSAGAEGLAQIMPENFASLGITDPFDPTQSINGGAQTLAENLRTFGGNTVDAIAAYNAGAGAVQRYGGVPPYAETQNYVQMVLGYAAQYPGAAQAVSGAGSVPAAQPGLVAPYAAAATASAYPTVASPSLGGAASAASQDSNATLTALYTILSAQADTSGGTGDGGADPSASLPSMLLPYTLLGTGEAA